MTGEDSTKKLTWIVWLLTANLIVLLVAAVGIVMGVLPRVERAVATTERVEQRFQAFADEVQPVLTAGAGKAIETIKKMDADKLSETATKGTDSVLESAAGRAKRFFDRDNKDTGEK